MNRRPGEVLRFVWRGGQGGAGALKARDGVYQIALGWDGRYGIPGPREVADLTGIAANFRVVKLLKHADTTIAIATNGTTTRVYRVESGAWVSKVDQLDGGASSEDAITGAATDAVSFKNVLAIALGSGQAYVFTTATTATGRTWDFTTSTKTAVNAERANFFLEQNNGLRSPRVFYCVNPNEVYFTEDLTNSDATGVNPTYIGDTASTQNYFTSVVEEPGSGRVLFGMRHALYTVHQEQGYEGIVERLTENFADAINDGGGGTLGTYNAVGRRNFEGPALVEGVLYYPVEGYDILAWTGAPQYNRRIAPRWASGLQLPRMDLPINVLVHAGGFLLAFLGSKSSATLKDVTNAPGGNSHLANQFSTASELWVGTPTAGHMVWHGILLQCSDPLTYAWFDEDDGYLYLASADAESANAQMTRCLFTIDHPGNRLTSSSVILNAGTVQVDLGAVDFDDEWTNKRALHARIRALGLAATAPSCELDYRVLEPWDTTAYVSPWEAFTDPAVAFMGEEFPAETLFHEFYPRLKMTGSGNTYARIERFELRAQWADQADEAQRRR